MRRLILILLLFPMVGFSQTVLNNDSLLYYFTHILNEYRSSQGLLPLEVDLSIKGFTDNWSNQMASINVVSHGSGENIFQKRVYSCNCFPGGKFLGENCTNITTPDVTTTNTNIVSPIKNIEPYMKKSYLGTITQYELAHFVFLNFKNSPPHNAFLLNKDVKRFYISGSRGKDWTYICYVAMD